VHHGGMTQAAAPTYVALGDSISIDDYAGGVGCGGASLLYANRDDDFPQWRGRDLASSHPDASFTLLATDGATVRTVREVQLPRLASLRVEPTLVTLTIGGNDIMSAYGDTRAARAAIERVGDVLTWALSEMRGLLALAGRVVVGTVYDPSDGTGEADRLGLPSWPDAVDVIAELNGMLRHVALAHGAAVAEIEQHFRGHGVLAGDPSQAQPRPAARDLWYCHIIEPNAWGASGVREAFATALEV
jgi:lysophospholipase L1-like esterase